jgi:hypothetical protein
MVFLTHLITILESPNTLIFFAPESIAFLNPWRRDLYYTLLLVHWNSSIHAINVLFPLDSFSMKPTLAPSRDLDPSKNKVHMLGSPLGLIMDFDFASFFELVGLIKLENTYNLSIDTILDCTS